jgi:hypothetical protein
MITLLAPLLGMIASLLPELIKMFARKQELAHELKLYELQMEAARQGVQLNILLEEAKADAREGDSLREHDIALSGGEFIDTLRASIRPVITYLFFLMFLIVKSSAAYVMLSNGTDIPTTLQSVWDQDSFAIFGAIMGFWFGSRTIDRYRSVIPEPSARRIVWENMTGDTKRKRGEK